MQQQHLQWPFEGLSTARGFSQLAVQPAESEQVLEESELSGASAAFEAVTAAKAVTAADSPQLQPVAAAQPSKPLSSVTKLFRQYIQLLQQGQPSYVPQNMHAYSRLFLSQLESELRCQQRALADHFDVAKQTIRGQSGAELPGIRQLVLLWAGSLAHALDKELELVGGDTGQACAEA
jgi:hypothetical protein